MDDLRYRRLRLRPFTVILRFFLFFLKAVPQFLVGIALHDLVAFRLQPRPGKHRPVGEEQSGKGNELSNTVEKQDENADYKCFSRSAHFLHRQASWWIIGSR